MNYAIFIGQHYIIAILVVTAVLQILRFYRLLSRNLIVIGNLLLMLVLGLLVKWMIPATGWWAAIVAMTLCAILMLVDDIRTRMVHRINGRLARQRRKEQQHATLAARRRT